MALKSKWHIIPAICSLSGALIIFVCAFFLAPKEPEYLRWLLYGAGFLILLGLIRFQRELSLSEISLKADLEKIEMEKKDLENKKLYFEKLKKEIEDDLEKRSIRIHKKEKDLAQKLATYQEWMEFPSGFYQPGMMGEVTDDDIQKLDHKVLALLRKEAEIFFEKVKDKYYVKEGRFLKERLINDIFSLIENVARIYNPDSENPLLETSIEQLLRAANRMALQLLVLLEQFPIDFKSYNIRKIHESVQASIKVYGIYKRFDFYWPILRPMYYLGRFSLGSNPISLGAIWALGEIARAGSKKLSSHLADRYALNLLYDMVFIIGCEAAGIFGGDFRHRESNWIYGAELTDLMARFPISRKSIKQTLIDIGNLQLRNEYDRIFLYRCIAAHKSADPERFRPDKVIPAEERARIAKRLEEFANQYIHGEDKALEAWRSDVEKRLGIKLGGDLPFLEEKPKNYKVTQGLRSISGFLIDIKRVSIKSLAYLLDNTRLILMIDKRSQRKEIIRAIIKNPPMIFDYPDLDPSDKIVEIYLEDLMKFHVSLAPRMPLNDEIIENTARYFRFEKTDKIKKNLDSLYMQYFTNHLLPLSPEKKPGPTNTRRLLSVLEHNESPKFLYKDIRLEKDRDGFAFLDSSAKMKLWLMGTDKRLLLINLAENDKDAPFPEVLWEGAPDGKFMAGCERVVRRLCDDCRVKGGKWNHSDLPGNSVPVSFIVPGSTIVRYDKFFSPLIGFF